MSENEREHLQDEALVLHVKNYQTADKYVVCFTKNHGKLRFIAYGARYVKNVQGRLLQPFACLNIEVQQGQKVDKLRSCELVRLPKSLDMQQMAYGAVAAELTAVLTEDREPAGELSELGLTGFAPEMHHCVGCGAEIALLDAAWFSPLQGGLICGQCKAAYTGEGLEPCAEGTRRLWQWRAALDYESPAAFSVRGGNLMELERILYKFIFFQTDKPLNSLNFLSQMGL